MSSRNGSSPAGRDADWLVGTPIDPLAETVEPLQTVAGIPFAYEGGCAVLVVGPTGCGRSTLIQTVLSDAAVAGRSCAYMSGEISAAEANARAADFAARRGLDPARLRDQLADLHYFDLSAVVAVAWREQDRWAVDIPKRFNVIGIDPYSTAGDAAGLDLVSRDQDAVAFHERLVKPIVAHGGTVLIPDNIGHSPEARRRVKGASGKQDKADVVLVCTPRKGELLEIRATKVRSVRAPFKRGDTWIFDREHLEVTRGLRVREQDETPRPTELMQRVSEIVEAEPGITVRNLGSKVGGGKEQIAAALRLLVDEGYIQTRSGARSAIHHESLKPYRASTDPPSRDRPATVLRDSHSTVPDCPAIHVVVGDGREDGETPVDLVTWAETLAQDEQPTEAAA